MDFFLRLRQRNLRKPPSTAELLNWVQTLAQWGAQSHQTLRDCAVPLRKSLSTLVKTQEDMEELERFVADYLSAS
jgi:hypothetical protein